MAPQDPDNFSPGLVAVAASLAVEVLAPAAADVDRTGRIPMSHLDQLASAGLYGAALDAAPQGFVEIVETLSVGCLATTFVWMQHHGLVRRLAALGAPSRDQAERLASLRAGRTRAGVVQAGLLPGNPLLTAAEDSDGQWSLNGFSPWCTGWGMVDELLVAARIEGDPARVGWFMVAAAEQPGLTIDPLRLEAVDATNTVALRFDMLQVEPARSLGFDEYAIVGHASGRGLRANGSLALGLARRCVSEIEAVGSEAATQRGAELAARINQVRSELDAADDAALPSSRADALRLAVDAAVANVAANGARSAMAGSAAARAMREATFLLVFGSRPTIKQELLRPA